MKKIFVILLMMVFAVSIFAIDADALVKGKLYSREYLNKYYIVIEERQYSFGFDCLIKHKTKMKIYAVRKDTGATKYRLLKEWEVAKGRYIKSMTHIGYFIDLKTDEYKTFDEIVNGF